MSEGQSKHFQSVLAYHQDLSFLIHLGQSSSTSLLGQVVYLSFKYVKQEGSELINLK